MDSDKHPLKDLVTAPIILSVAAPAFTPDPPI